MRVFSCILVSLGMLAGPGVAVAQGIFDLIRNASPQGPGAQTPVPSPSIPSVIPSPVPLPPVGSRSVPVVITSLSGSTISGCFQDGQICVHNLPVVIDAVAKTATGRLGNLYFVFPLQP